MNTGVEGGETAVKLARRWGYDVKGIPQNEATVLFCENNFWGRSLSASSSDPSCRTGFGPFMSHMDLVPYADLDALETALRANPNVCAFMFEPIQGEAGVVVPPDGYLAGVRRLCTEHRVLMIADEVQTGLCRTGTLLAVDHEDVRPDLVILGKALSGGVYPVSAVLSSDEVMLTIRPGEHGSTYGGNPLGCAVAIAALGVLRDGASLTTRWRWASYCVPAYAALATPAVTTVRGRGLPERDGHRAECRRQDCWRPVLRPQGCGPACRKGGHEHIVRLAPPLVVTADQIEEAVAIIERELRRVFG